MVAFPKPTAVRGSRAEVLLGYLDYFRERAIEKLGELPSDEVARSRLPTGWSPLELLHHLRHVERRWLEWGFLGLAVDDPWADSHHGRWFVPDDLGPDAVVAALRAQGEHTRAVVADHALDEVGRPGPRWNGAAPATLERVLLHLVQEYARHLGHLDVVVELSTDGAGQ
ncbi:DinB family protein [Actinomycetospora chlora]|uniref:DinB family protein n=1 Tax=Actinomycetospora chlora TaxID=663608 RepID=A0ABP9BIC1_9PSEU